MSRYGHLSYPANDIGYLTLNYTPLRLILGSEKHYIRLRKHVRRAVSLWDESRVWDPGD